MNYGRHYTHWKGKALRDLTREDLIEALQEAHQQLLEAREDHLRQLAKQGRSEYFVL